jgi:hypothetical protein
MPITNNASNISLRVIPLWCVGSNGTSPATNEAGGQPTWMLGGVYYGNTTNTLSAWSANAGEYYVVLAQSETSVIGRGVVRYNSATALESATPFEIVAADSFNSVNLGLSAMPAVAPNAAGGFVTFGAGAGQLNPSTGSVGVIYADYSSLVTVGVGNVKAATYSGVTIDGVNRVNSSVTIANATYSAVTVRLDSVDYSSVVTVGVGSVKAANYSGVTVEIGNSGVTAGRAIADRIILRSVSGGTDSTHSIGDALRVLRNRVDVGSSVLTVYMEDDVTSAWTASIATTANQVFLTSINPH